MEEFLACANIARVATVKNDGAPFVVPVWYEWDGKYCYIVGRIKSSWVDNIRRDPRVSVAIDNSEPPHQKVLIEGKAKIIGEKLEDWIEIGKRMAVKYNGSEAGMKYFEDSKDQPRVTIRIKPETITTWILLQGREATEKSWVGWHPRYLEPGSKWHKEYLRERSKTR